MAKKIDPTRIPEYVTIVSHLEHTWTPGAAWTCKLWSKVRTVIAADTVNLRITWIGALPAATARKIKASGLEMSPQSTNCSGTVDVDDAQKILETACRSDIRSINVVENYPSKSVLAPWRLNLHIDSDKGFPLPEMSMVMLTIDIRQLKAKLSEAKGNALVLDMAKLIFAQDPCLSGFVEVLPAPRNGFGRMYGVAFRISTNSWSKAVEAELWDTREGDKVRTVQWGNYWGKKLWELINADGKFEADYGEHVSKELKYQRGRFDVTRKGAFITTTRTLFDASCEFGLVEGPARNAAWIVRQLRARDLLA